MLPRSSSRACKDAEEVFIASGAGARGAALMRIWAILATEGSHPPRTRGRSIEVIDSAGRSVVTVSFDEAVKHPRAMH